MMWIHNVTKPGVPDDQPHQYRIMINQREIGRFEHTRIDGAAECFRRAADALDEAQRMDYSGYSKEPIRE